MLSELGLGNADGALKSRQPVQPIVREYHPLRALIETIGFAAYQVPCLALVYQVTHGLLGHTGRLCQRA